MFDQLKQLKNLRQQAKQMESALDKEQVLGVSSANKVSLEMNGNQKILNINIEPKLLSPDHKDELEQAIKQAHQDAIQKVKQLMAQKLYSSGINLPQ